MGASMHEEASQAYDAWCDKHEKERSNHFLQVELHVGAINAVTAEPLNVPYPNKFMENEYMDMTEIELAGMKDANEDD